MADKIDKYGHLPLTLAPLPSQEESDTPDNIENNVDQQSQMFSPIFRFCYWQSRDVSCRFPFSHEWLKPCTSVEKMFFESTFFKIINRWGTLVNQVNDFDLT